MMNVVFVMVDGQEDFARMALGDQAGEDAIKIAGKVAKFAAEYAARKIIYTMDTHGDDYLDTQEGRNLPVVHCIPGTKGFGLCHEIMEDAGVKPNQCRFVRKVTFGSEDLIRCKDIFVGADLIVMCGLRTDICVVSKRYANTAESHSYLTAAMGYVDGRFRVGVSVKNAGVFFPKEFSDSLGEDENAETFAHFAKSWTGLNIPDDLYGSTAYKRYLLGVTLENLYRLLKERISSGQRTDVRKGETEA